MEFTYKDLNYIRVALQLYDESLLQIAEGDCSEDEFSEAQEDIMYLQRLRALTDKKINEWDSSGPSLNPVK